jgi:WD40 repeat protein
MKDARVYATATLLANGKILVTGGSDSPGAGGTIYASAELYDPKTGKFTATGSMTAARFGHTATLLSDGAVLIAGGYGCPNTPSTKACVPAEVGPSVGRSLASAELYDPSTGKFRRTGSMSIGRQSATATLLANGRVLLAGSSETTRAELYDPTSGRFITTGSSLIDFPHNDATATSLPAGKVLVTGTDASGPRAELYDPAAGKFTQISFAIAPGAAASAQYNGKGFDRAAPDTATLLTNGRVLLNEFGYLETYDPGTGAFTPAGFMSEPGQWGVQTATLLKDGRVLFTGGWAPTPDNTDIVASAGLYDPASGPLGIASMHAARVYQTATLLPDGSVLIAGGSSDNATALSSAELFKP